MKGYFSILLILGMAVCQISAYAQSNTTDSLLNLLHKAKEDTNKVNILYQLSEICEEADILKYAVPALELAEKINYKKGIANAATNVGYVYSIQSDYAKALSYAQKSLAIREEIGDKKGISVSLTNIGYVYYNQGAIPKALEYFIKSLQIKETTGDEKGAANGLNNVAQIYNSQGDTEKAIEYWQQCMALSTKIDYKFGLANALLGLGHCYQMQGNYAQSLAYFEKCLTIRNQINNKEGQVNVLASIGSHYARQGMDQKALEYLHKSLQIAKEINDRQGTSIALINIGNILAKQQQYTPATVYLEEALQIGTKTGEPKSMALASEALSKVYAATGSYKKAYEMQALFKTMSDSISSIETKKAVLKKQMAYEFDKREMAHQAAQEKKDILNNEKIQQYKIIRNFSIGGAVLILIAGLYLIYRYREKNRTAKHQALLQERLRISRELHDEVGATLSGIVMYSHLTKQQVQADNAGAVEKSLTIMQQSSEEMVGKLNEIVWLVNPEKDTLPKLVQRLEEYARNIATAKNMKVEFTSPPALPEAGLSFERRRNIYLIAKEAINNAIKYSGGNLLSLLVQVQAEKLTILISDNGKGFDTSPVYPGNGLVNMRKRAEELGARLVLTSAAGKGTTIAIECQIG
ncbi:tetratricopeptide repeat protein [Pseudoflavitalea sp. X16]|uniref:tetratricopeptide repeat-containing sensor histidine kinase n=1 Tax=Paraflavitalea devenefica TaxID=2716334 RepID=UPI00141E6CD8|nr:sensor histidine kinase [Paraflavitalea devenefica]NII27840.1 tetratricopeptide repeat protein [Paraflavitalea devenefica]